MERRTPLRIAVDSLSDARRAASRGAWAEAIDAIDLGITALGPHYRRGRLFDETGIRLCVAMRQRVRGWLRDAYAGLETVLEDRIAEYEGRDGERT
ncbi:MAG: hypothetical protein R3B09_18925 [Nannocystaceae bacterium]